mmetsp:Transcript_16132/g.46999  ORF Transcript_16132/g.46999 Transcript_16132/m.46999 type:complete len:290 (+) Transcript_16132:1363-2232(+)
MLTDHWDPDGAGNHDAHGNGYSVSHADTNHAGTDHHTRSHDRHDGNRNGDGNTNDHRDPDNNIPIETLQLPGREAGRGEWMVVGQEAVVLPPRGRRLSNDLDLEALRLLRGPAELGEGMVGREEAVVLPARGSRMLNGHHDASSEQHTDDRPALLRRGHCVLSDRHAWSFCDAGKRPARVPGSLCQGHGVRTLLVLPDGRVLPHPRLGRGAPGEPARSRCGPARLQSCRCSARLLRGGDRVLSRDGRPLHVLQEPDVPQWPRGGQGVQATLRGSGGLCALCGAVPGEDM